MQGCETFGLRSGRLAAAIAASFLTFTGSARAQNPSPTLPAVGMPATTAKSATAAQEMPAPTTAPYFPGLGAAPAPLPGPTYPGLGLPPTTVPGPNNYPGLGATPAAC